jgi:hypothetical protein
MRMVNPAGAALGAAIFLLTALAAPPAAAFRCDESIVEEGLTFVEVLERCGEPDFEYHRPSYLVPGVLVLVDEWLYEPGFNKFRRLLVFENGRLVRIETRPKPRQSAEQIKGEL